ncbi:ankyrin [Lindgomyces ingoldianus]|uniref:Ankyrin n=1 Tax=Lindgomyces ingoldianus TaxID=673940 RepID=A0ACB6R6P9_9PLEO|nr:ankyrin [Lindgomyces ingoldianus]KAF2474460.1 ankyrin [Lindgomyces ingoldianus]
MNFEPGPSHHPDYILRDPNDPPAYDEHGPALPEGIQQIADAIREQNNHDLPILEFPLIRNTLRSAILQQDIVDSFFNAIRTKKDEVVAALIENNIVTPETTDKDGRTPLLAAIEAGNIRTVQELMDFDANINAYGVVGETSEWTRKKGYTKIYRTPLQLAAAQGNLTIVKLLMETYNADDSMIAPDGELALRLAAKNNHREVVNYLPTRRGGGWRRWKAKHHKAMKRTKKAAKSIYQFFRFCLWSVPRFFLWSVPKHLIILPLVLGSRWLWKHGSELPGIVWRWLNKIPQMIWDVLKEVPKFLKECTMELAQMLWHLIKATPKAIGGMVVWLWQGIKSMGTAIGSTVGRLFSFIHTLLFAIVNLFRGLTLQDVWNGFMALLRAVFVDGLKKLWKWLCTFGEVTKDILEKMFGCIGFLVWLIIRGLIELIIYVPKKMLEIFASMGSSIAGGFSEVLIWINPKRN